MKSLSKHKAAPLGVILFILAFVLLSPGFYRNQWQVVRQKKFSLFQKDVEAYVIARLVLTRQSGILSQGGLLGWGDVDPNDVNEDDYEHQYELYLKGGSFQTYDPKRSHPGFQGIFFSTLDQLSPLSASDNLRMFRFMTAGVFALAMAGAILWFSMELGWLPAIFVLASILTSQWMTLFGRNLFFVSGLFYIPMLVLLFRLQNERTGQILSQGRLFQLVFWTILLKCLFNGYDFILPTLGMTATPIVFYGIKNRWSRAQFIQRFMGVVFASVAAIALSLVILSIQVMFASGSFVQGVDYILETVNRRTLSNDPNLPSIYTEAKNASTWSILKTYMSETYFSDVYVPYYIFMILFGCVSVLQLLIERIRFFKVDPSSQGVALIAATWFSLLGPLSWYVIFKSVAYFHTHMNYLPWHMPFTLFGFGLCGYFLQSLFRALANKANAR